MKYSKLLMVILLALSLVVIATGCAEEDQSGKPGVADFEKEREALANRDTSKKGKKVKKKKKSKKGTQAKGSSGGTGYAAGEADYFYDPRGKRDPFRSIRFAADDSDEEQKRDFGPLGDFELGQLELSAVIWDAGNPRALILDPGGRSYIVREGSAIGKNNGQVIHIGDNLVLVKETYENFAGEQTTKDVELRIRLSQGG
ncbi:MAG: pilus assembly protein PilP [bacterium]|nr:pilus assembly protein PilP [bacterium]